MFFNRIGRLLPESLAKGWTVVVARWVTAFRSAFSMLGTLTFVSLPLIFLPRGAPLGDVLNLVSFTVLLMVPLTVVPLVLWVRDPLPSTSSHVRLLNGLIAQGRDRVFLMFVAAVLLYGTANGVINSMAVFSFSPTGKDSTRYV